MWITYVGLNPLLIGAYLLSQSRRGAVGNGELESQSPSHRGLPSFMKIRTEA